jgi:hypothetical protein
MGAISSLFEEITCSTYARTETDVDYCCKSNVTGNQFECNSGNNNKVSNITSQTDLTQVPCYNSSWIVDGGASADEIQKDVSFRYTQTYCYRSVFCLEWCVPGINTAGMYVSLDPLYNYSPKILEINKNNKSKVIEYDFNYLNLWAMKTDYNLKSFLKINNYIKVSGGISYIFEFPNDNGVELISPYGVYFCKNVSIFTTMVSYKLMDREYTSNANVYLTRSMKTSLKLIKSFYNFIKYINNLPMSTSNDDNVINDHLVSNNINDLNKKEYIKKVYENYVTNDDIISQYLFKYDSVLMFITNMIVVNAKKNEVYNKITKFNEKLVELLWDFNETYEMTTQKINDHFKQTVFIIDVDYIFETWIDFILRNDDNIYIMAAAYAPKNLDDVLLRDDNKSILINAYINYDLNRQKFDFYLENAIMAEDCSKFVGQEAPAQNQATLAGLLKKIDVGDAGDAGKENDDVKPKSSCNKCKK